MGILRAQKRERKKKKRDNRPAYTTAIAMKLSFLSLQEMKHSTKHRMTK